MKPEISVVMPVYNGAKYLRDSVDSILNQTYENFELVIINDGSTDSSVDIVKNFSDKRIKILNLEHCGVVKSLNKGIDSSIGKYIIRCDADDISLPDRFKKLLDFIKKDEKIGVCGSWATSIDKNNNDVGEIKYPPTDHADIKKYLIYHNSFIHPSVIFNREIIKKLGSYRNFKHNEDYELWTRVLMKYEGYNIPEKLIKYRIHSEQVTQKFNLKMRLISFIVRFLAIKRLKF